MIRELQQRIVSCAAGMVTRNVKEGDANYKEITEGRGPTYLNAAGEVTNYSWCGDLVTWVWQCAGICDPSVINRTSVQPNGWRIGENISLFITGGQKANAFLSPGKAIELAATNPDLLVGAALIIVRPAGDHIDVVESWTKPLAPEVISGNAMNDTVSRRTRPIGTGSGSWQIRGVTIALPWAKAFDKVVAAKYGPVDPVAMKLSYHNYALQAGAVADNRTPIRDVWKPTA